SIPEGIKVTADANRSQITLSGAVASKEVRNQAVELAKSASPGAVVVDMLQVQPQEVPRAEYTADMAQADREKARTLGDSIGNSADDAWVHSTIVRKLLRDPETPVANIHVDVRGGVVTLRGHVDSDDQKTEAGNVAQKTDGVKRVNNRLRVKA
ncbi:MAG TPA: BON domain-containing protein, partial [Bryobacteraceae bacterium]|nr:BON domain-containing protein [Bryobacteraceae bacterium]